MDGRRIHINGVSSGLLCAQMGLHQQPWVQGPAWLPLWLTVTGVLSGLLCVPMGLHIHLTRVLSECPRVFSVPQWVSSSLAKYNMDGRHIHLTRVLSGLLCVPMGLHSSPWMQGPACWLPLWLIVLLLKLSDSNPGCFWPSTTWIANGSPAALGCKT